MSNNYEVAYKTEWRKLKSKEPMEVSDRLNVVYSEEKLQYVVQFLLEDYILDCKNETIYRSRDRKTPPISDSIIILNYLTFSKNHTENKSKMISLKEIPNGGVLFYPAFYKTSILALIDTFGNNIVGFERKAKRLWASEIKLGDKGYRFQVLPKINVYIGIWEGDEEISPSATILFDESIQYLVHIETIIGIGMTIAQKICAEEN